ncbi:MAG TPA: Omp28-related outer membrane protein, partial [Bacteroidales bacterium]|nr:Omp28-related outer membrane protein [Bacteroidales bacterium]
TPGQAGSSLGVNYIHNNTMRAAISNVWGESNVITSPNEGTTYSKTFTYTIPSDFDLEQLSFVAFVSQYNSNVNKRNIYNSKAVKMSDIISGAYVNDHTYHPTDPASIPTDNYTTPELLIYPNPADNFLFVETILNIESIKIFNVQGQYIDSKPIANTMIPISHLANGIYILQITTQEGNILTQRFVKQ